MAPLVYLVSGANRGLGLGLVKALSARENTVVFAGARNPDGAKDLQALAAQRPEKLYIVKLVSGDVQGSEAAISFIRDKAGRLDVVIANAAICLAYGPAYKASEDDLRQHFEVRNGLDTSLFTDAALISVSPEVNVIGTFVLFKAALPLLKASSASESAPPKFVAVSSLAGGLERGASGPFEMTPYAISKAAENFLARKLHFEHEKDGLVVFPICPGLVDTDMANYGAERDEGVRSRKFKTVDDTAALLLKVIDRATQENEGGQFMSFDGTKIPW
ncbi:NAD(P)-binding protein [Punctularia strigosozonata HHB-11173 SS5]|uniref:NAD(P)-binding protein n=1 Tax=Punctularia strigosozonata (strain HHB-11173) TaxID=741275 RepID=UPI0004417223|nr:NAD(P)-binding protein [Punctularia strigosozonata HHB-11173 SS5]EIN06061.1 NAD(P)-binding protein [Punctularia strigosozonata HHB-11173 SS5]